MDRESTVYSNFRTRTLGFIVENGLPLFGKIMLSSESDLACRLQMKEDEKP
jgi:hypothetical protein